MTLRELIAKAETALRAGPHPERAKMDAEALLLHAFRSSGREHNRAWLLVHGDEDDDVRISAELETLIARRAAGEPIQYITGEAEFFGLPFTVTPDVLIPRPETEHLVETVLKLAKNLPISSETPLTLADIGTGSGIIAIALAHALPQARITATDISLKALAIARSNAERNAVANRIEFIEGDLLAPLAGRKFAILASNPPYIPLADHDSLSTEVRDHEPHTALFAGNDGLNIYHRLIPSTREHLIPGGWLVMEIGHSQQPAIEAMLLDGNFSDVHFVADYQGIPRVALGCSMRAGA